jgi:GNAT superfamily N-acetyltransferase
LPEPPQRADFRDPDVQRLVVALEAELLALYGRPDQEPPPADAFDGGVFVVVREGGTAVACGGLRITDGEPGVGEIKRMFTVPAARGRGHARAVLEALVAFARERGLARLILETGVRQLAALALYEGAGWEPIARFAPYEDEPDSVCLERRLTDR